MTTNSQLHRLRHTGDELHNCQVPPRGPESAEAAATMRDLAQWSWQPLRATELDEDSEERLVAGFADDGSIHIGRWGGWGDDHDFILSGIPICEANIIGLYELKPIQKYSHQLHDGEEGAG